MNKIKYFFIIIAVSISVVFLSNPALCGTTGIVSGIIKDAVSENIVSEVKVTINELDISTFTDDSGYYVLTNIPSGDYTLSTEVSGYDNTSVDISVLMDLTTKIDFNLQPEIAGEETIVVIDTHAIKQPDAQPSVYIIDSKREKMVRTEPNTLYQISGIVKSQPGVLVDSDGWPHIRGGRANQIGYMIDGIPVTEPVTNGFGTNSVTAGLDKMEIFTGGYMPEYGNAISGVFNQVIKSGETFSGNNINLLFGTNNYAGIYPELSGKIKEKGSYYASGYLWKSDFDGTSFEKAKSSDFNMKLTYDASSSDKLTFLSANGSALYTFPTTHIGTLDSSIEDATVPIPTGKEKDHSHQSFSLNALTYTHSFSPASFISVKPYLFKNKWEFDALSDFFTGIGAWVKGQSITKGLKIDYLNQINQKHLVKSGIITMGSTNKFRSASPEMFGYDYITNADTNQIGLYLQDQMKLNSYCQLDYGLRYDRMKYLNDNINDFSESQLSPRVNISFAVSPATNLRFSYGKMIQFVQTQALDRKFISPFWGMIYQNADRLYPERSTQFDLGIEHQINKDYLLLVTPFYRKFNDLLQTTSVNPATPGQPPYIYENIGAGTSKGFELLLKKRPSKNWSGWLSYTYLVAKATASGTGLPENNQLYVDWDQRHSISAIVNYIKNGWNYSLFSEYGSGLPYTYGLDTRNSSRVSPHITFNANISKTITSGLLADSEINLGISNIFNNCAALTKDTEGNPVNKVPSRFFNLSIMRRF